MEIKNDGKCRRECGIHMEIVNGQMSCNWSPMNRGEREYCENDLGRRGKRSKKRAGPSDFCIQAVRCENRGIFLDFVL